MLLASTALLGALAPRAAQAACATDFCWNTSSGIWSNSGNWTPGGGPPASGNTVTVANGGTATVDSSNAQSSNTTIDSGSSVVVESGGTWTDNGNSPSFNVRGGAIIVGESGTGGALTIDNGGTVSTTGTIAGTVLIGDQAGSSGTITVGDGGTGTASLTNNGPPGFPGNFYVGYGGSGVLKINAGGSVSGFSGIELGVLAGSSGSVTVDDGSLAAGGTVIVGGAGTGTLMIENGGTVGGTTGIVGGSAGSDGSSATVTGSGSTWSLSANLQIGSGGAGGVTIENGGAVNLTGASSQLYVGDGAAGTLTVDGGTLTSSNGSDAFIGATGTGASSMLIENGGVVTTSAPAFIGASNGPATGSVTVTGAGSSWDIGSGYLEIENTGTTTGLTVEDGASLTTGEVLVGGYVTSAGNNAMLVTGAGTTWQAGGSILLGSVTDAGAGSGTGTLSVMNGAQVSGTGNVDIGYSPDGGGVVTDSITVDGTNSQLTTTSNLRVGYYGTGALTISNGAQVSDAEGDIGYSSTNASAASAIFGAATPTNSVGTAVVTGAGSVWSNTTLIVGDNAAVSAYTGTGTGTSTATLTVSDGGEVISTNAIIVGANVGATGTINIGAAFGQAAVAPGSISAPAVTFGAGGGTIVFNHTSDSFVFSAAIQGAGSVDVENGTTELTGTNTYTGATTINGGTLDVAGSLTGTSGVTVNAGGTLAGQGVIDPLTVTINSGGTLEPGAPGVPGTAMTITGNLVFQSGANYYIALNPSSATMANVSGTASLAGSVKAVFASGSYVTKTYDILHSAGLGGTTFDGLTLVPTNFDATLSYTATDVYLNLTAQIAESGNFSNNQHNVADAINGYFNSSGTLPPQFASVSQLTGDSLGNALSQLDGEASTGAESGAFQLTTQFLDLMLDPFMDGRGDAGDGSAGPTALGFGSGGETGLPEDALAYAGVKAPSKRSTVDRRWGAWATAFGGGNRTSGDSSAGSNDLSASTYGFAAGMDYHLTPHSVVGLALAGGGTNWDLANALGNGRSSAFQVGGYGINWFGSAYVAAALSFSNQWFTTNRTAVGDQLRANFIGQTYGGRLEGGYRFALRADLGVTPYAAVQVQAFHTPSYSEDDLTGGGFALSYASMNATDTRTELGARVDNTAQVGGKRVVLTDRLAWAHDFVSNPKMSATFQALPGSSFTVNGAPIPQDSALATVGARLYLNRKWSVAAKFDGDFAPDSETYDGTGSLRYVW